MNSGVISLLLVAFAAPAFVSRVPYPPLEARLAASGGSPARIVRVKKLADTDVLQSGKRYKFVVDEHKQLSVAPLPADAPSNEYVHPILAGGAPVLTAGGIRVERAGGQGKITAVVIDQDSKAYCPTFESLARAEEALAAAGVPAAAIKRENHVPECAH